MTVSPQDLQQQLRGVIAFTPTPFHPDERVDYDALAQQVNRLIINGAHVVVVCGGVGEYVSLTNDEYRECISVAVEATNKRVPLLAGIGHSTRIAADLAEYAATVGVSGLMINPLYFIDPPDAGLYSHYRTIADASGLGMMIFSTKGQVYGPDLVEELAEIDEIIALKDEWGDLKLFVETRERLGDRCLAWINGMAETLAVPCSPPAPVYFWSDQFLAQHGARRLATGFDRKNCSARIVDRGEDPPAGQAAGTAKGLLRRSDQGSDALPRILRQYRPFSADAYARRRPGSSAATDDRTGHPHSPSG
ncbi:MAG: dihydrodipicolinate synthase family protein [Thermomicrobiales bacterium]